jgi:hypothetical protein
LAMGTDASSGTRRRRGSGRGSALALYRAGGAATRRHGGRPAAEFPVPSPMGAQARVVIAAGPSWPGAVA